MRLAPLSLALLLPGAPVAAQSTTPLIGRWDLVIETTDHHGAGWLEVRHSGSSTLIGSFQGTVGSARPVARIDYTDGAFRFTIPPQWNDAEGENTIEGRLAGDSIRGTIRFANGKPLGFRGGRAPALRRAKAPVWGTPVPLFNGKDLAGWKALGSGTTQWTVEQGVLKNVKAGTDLVTERTFSDFKLRLEVRFPPRGNSGIYLRGRYEVQVEDTPGSEPQYDGLGAIYGQVIPSELVNRGPNTWHRFEITLVGRKVTVVIDGRVVISEAPIPGITGGAMDSHEGAPGPIFLQGDHGPVEYRNLVIVPAR